MSKKTVENFELKTVGFIALDNKGNPITGKIYQKRATAKGLETKAFKAAKVAAEEKLKKSLERLADKFNQRL